MGSRRIQRSERGTSLVEVMVATVLLSLVMSAAYSSIISQMQTSAAQLQVSDAINKLRLAQRIIAEQIWVAGFGVPPNTATNPSPPADIITANAQLFSFRTKLSTGHTYLTANAAVNATMLTVLSTAKLPNGATIYLTDTKQWYSGTVSGVSGNTVNISPALTKAFAMGSLVTPMDTVTFQLSGNQLQTCVGSCTTNSRMLINNVTNLNFGYDSTTITAIRKIDIDMSVRTEGVLATTHQPLTFNLKTSVTPPGLKN
jgi:type II secretory pathway pseudopilin PulG